MKTRTLLNALLIITVLAAMTACEDNRVPKQTEPRYRIKRTDITEQFGRSTFRFITTYFYRTDGKVEKYTIQTPFVSTNPTQTVMLQYNSDGKLTGSQAVGEPGSPKNFRTTYTYDATGNVLKYTYYYDAKGDDTYSLITTYDFSYATGNPYPTKVKIVSPGMVNQQIVYTYENGNVVKEEVASTSPENTVNISTKTYQYDDKRNPYVALAALQVKPDWFSKNNVTLNYRPAKYNADGLLIERNNTPDVSVYSEKIEYEQY